MMDEEATMVEYPRSSAHRKKNKQNLASLSRIPFDEAYDATMVESPAGAQSRIDYDRAQVDTPSENEESEADEVNFTREGLINDLEDEINRESEVIIELDTKQQKFIDAFFEATGTKEIDQMLSRNLILMIIQKKLD